MIKVYGFPNTRSVRAVWALEEAGVAYEYELIDLMKGAARKPNYLELNPGGKVPALIDGDLVLTESAAICTYVADSFAPGKLAPAMGGKMRARYDQWCYFAMTELEQPLWTITKHTFALPAHLRIPQVIETAKWEFAAACKVLAKGMRDSPYILGDTFTMADVLIGHTLAWGRLRQLPLESAVLDEYANRMLARDAFVRATAREGSATA